MTIHARDTVDNRAVGLLLVEHDVGRPLVETPAVRCRQHVRLQAVGEAENDLATVVLELAGVGPRPQRVGQHVLAADVPGEIVALPVSAVRRLVALDHPVVVRDTRPVERRANGALITNVVLDLHDQEFFELGDC